MMKEATPLIHITRGPLVECVHRGHIAVADCDGQIIREAGDPHWVTYARSSAKLLQAVPVVASGAAARFGLTDKEIALICASHSGERQHTDVIYQILAKLGLDDSFLQCGAHFPFHKPSARALQVAGEAPKAVHNNCSGKHCGMLALAKFLGATLDDYMLPGHPVQQAMLASIASFAGVPEEHITLGTDGCGVPVYGLPLSNLATAYARLGAPQPDGSAEAEACRTILRSVAAFPEMVAGSDRYDTALLHATDGRVVGKMGAEGVFAVSFPSEGLGLALKIEDGTPRALYPAVTEALVQLGWINAEASLSLAAFHMPPIRNWGGRIVGATVPSFRLT